MQGCHFEKRENCGLIANANVYLLLLDTKLEDVRSNARFTNTRILELILELTLFVCPWKSVRA